MHDASAQTLEEAITKMYHYQLGYDKLDKKEVRLLVAFLKTLTGEYNGQTRPGRSLPCLLNLKKSSFPAGANEHSLALAFLHFPSVPTAGTAGKLPFPASSPLAILRLN